MIEGMKDRLQSRTDQLSDVEKRLDTYVRWKAHTNERIDERVKAIGNGAHIFVPKDYAVQA